MKKVLLALFMTITLNAQADVLKQVPDLQLELLNGNTASLHDFLSDGPVLMDFWATWCKPCKREMKFLDQFQKEYGDQGLTVLAVNQDDTRTISQVKPYIRSRRYKFTVALDQNKQVGQKMNVQVLPTTFLINQDGEIVWQHIGFLPGDEKDIEAEIKKILAGQAE